MTAAFRDKANIFTAAEESTKKGKKEKPQRPNTAGIHEEDINI